MVGKQFRMIGESQLFSLKDGGRFPVEFGKDRYPVPDTLDGGGADERHRHAFHFCEIAVNAETAKLPPVGIAPHGHVQRPEICRGIVFDSVRQQDQPCAGGKNRQSRPDPLLERTKQLQFPEQFSDHGAFPAGDHQRIECLLQIGALPDLHDLGSALPQGGFVLGEIALQGKNSDAMRHLPRSSMMSLISSALIPTIASPRPLESSAIMAAS